MVGKLSVAGKLDWTLWGGGGVQKINFLKKCIFFIFFEKNIFLFVFLVIFFLKIRVGWKQVRARPKMVIWDIGWESRCRSPCGSAIDLSPPRETLIRMLF